MGKIVQLEDNADFDDLKRAINEWLVEHYAHVQCPGAIPLGPVELTVYYAHCEVAMLEMNLVDRFPKFLNMIRRAKNKVRRLTPLEYKKEIIRSKVAF